jgi:UDP-N-acetylglucosamine enolpyruvyl transferase
MGTFKIEGGKSLKGEITPQGAKNEALQVLCPVLLTSEKVRVTNIPDIIDVNKLITLLGNLGVSMSYACLVLQTILWGVLSKSVKSVISRLTKYHAFL